jgi:hypothetical protein
LAPSEKKMSQWDPQTYALAVSLSKKLYQTDFTYADYENLLKTLAGASLYELKRALGGDWLNSPYRTKANYDMQSLIYKRYGLGYMEMKIPAMLEAQHLSPQTN